MIRRNSVIRTIAFGAAAVALAHPASWAEGFRNPPAGGFSLARAGGNIALADNPEAAMHNPANIVNIPEAAAQANVTLVHVTVDYENGGERGSTRDPLKLLPNFFGTVPLIPGKLSAGIALTTPFGLSNEWRREGAFGSGGSLRYAAPHYTEMMTINGNPTISWRINDRLAIGAGVDVYWSQLTFRQYLPFGVLGETDSQAKGDGTGVGGDAGITFNVTEKQRLAVTYRSPFTVEYEGDFRANDVPGPVAGMGFSQESRFATEIEFPTIVSAGYGIQLTDTVQLEANGEWIEFSNFDNLGFDFGSNAPFLPANIRQDWEDTFTAGIAAEWQYTENWAFRGGYKFYESPVPDQTFSPTIPDANQHALTAGLSYRQGHHSADFAYGWIKYDDRNITANQNPAFLGRYEMAVHLFSLGYTYHF